MHKNSVPERKFRKASRKILETASWRTFFINVRLGSKPQGSPIKGKKRRTIVVRPEVRALKISSHGNPVVHNKLGWIDRINNPNIFCVTILITLRKLLLFTMVYQKYIHSHDDVPPIIHVQ